MTTQNGTSGRDTLTGTSGSDTISGNGDNDEIFGGAGDDVLYGGDGNDTIEGGQNSDWIDGGSGNDTLYGGDGYDDIGGGAGDDEIYGGNDGTYDDLYGGTGNDTLYGGDDAGNWLYGGDDNDTLYGGAGSETLSGDAGDDRIEAGGGNDSVYGGSGNDSIFGGLGADMLQGGAGNDAVRGDDGNDFLSGGSGDDTIFGGDGNDTLQGEEGSDSVYGGLGDDTIQMMEMAGNDTIDGGDGIDRVKFYSPTDVTMTYAADQVGTYTQAGGTATGTVSNVEIIETGGGNDTIDASQVTTDMTVYGGSGDDSIQAGSGNDVLAAASGSNTISGGDGNDTITGGAEADEVSGDAGDDTLFGGDGNDRIFGGDGIDALYGGAGNDSLSGGAGDDQIDGGAGDDELHGDAAYSQPIVLLNFDGGNATTATDDSGNGFDGIYTSGAAESGSGYTGATGDTALQLDGTDDYVEIPADDAFQLENGTISLRFNADSLGSKTALFSRDSSGLDDGGHLTVWVDSAGMIEVRIQSDSGDIMLTSGTETVSAGEWNHVAFSFGSEGAKLFLNGEVVDTDSYTGGIEGNNEPIILGANQWASGDGVADSLTHHFAGQIDEFALFDTQVSQFGVSQINQEGVTVGGGGADVLSGGDGNDDIFGGADGDTLSGGAGKDTLSGGSGDDTLTGGTGEDVFDFVKASGNDVITDFDTGDTDGNGQYNDQLDVSGLQNPDGSPVTAFDVNVVDDGAGNAKLVFPEGESIVLSGVTPAQMSSPAQLVAAGIPCFTPGAMIATENGERAIETLQVGDRIFTRDHGFQPIRWIGRRTVRAEGRFAPIRINTGVVTGQITPLLVSPQHRMLFTGYRAELLFAENEVLVAAKHLVDGTRVVRECGGDITYVHLMFDCHEVIYANGAATESFNPGDEAIEGITESAREELFALFPGLRADLSRFGPTARKCLRGFEAEMLRM